MLHPVFHRIDHIGSIQPGTGVEDHNVFGSTTYIVQHRQQHGFGLLGRFDPQRPVAGHHHAEIFRVNLVLCDLAIFELTHQRRRTQTHFVHAVFAVDHHGVLCTQTLQGPNLNAHQIGVKHAHQNIGCAGRVGQRPQQVENGLDAQLFANRGHVFHGGMVIWRKHEAHADLLDAPGNGLRREVDVDAQRLHHVGTAALAADASAPMLADLGTGGSGHKHRAG